MIITRHPYCLICKHILSNGPSVNGQKRFFCINAECPDRFKTVNDQLLLYEIMNQEKDIATISINDVDGETICSECGMKYEEHPKDPIVSFTTFKLLCNGAHVRIKQ